MLAANNIVLKKQMILHESIIDDTAALKLNTKAICAIC